MGWTSVTIDIQKNDQSQTTYDDNKDTTKQTCIVVYQAVSDTVEVTTVEAQSASAGGVTIPTPGNTYSIGGVDGWTCTQVFPQRRQESPFLFDVQCTFTIDSSPQKGSSGKWDINISFSGEKYTQAAEADNNGDAIVNSAGEQFDPPLQKTFYDERIEISYKCLSPPDLSGYRGYVNSSEVSFTITGISRDYQQNQLILEEGSISTTVTAGDAIGTPVWDVKLTFLSRADTFTVLARDRGFFQLAEAGPWPGGGKLYTSPPPGGTGTARTGAGIQSRFPVPGQYGQTFPSPVDLDGTGLPLASGDPVYWGFDIQPQADLNPLFDGLS